MTTEDLGLVPGSPGTAAKQVSQALVALATNDALTADDLESAFTNAQSAIQAGCSYDDEILANVILGFVQAARRSLGFVQDARHSQHENGHTRHGSELDSSLRYFQQAVALDAGRKSGEYVFSDVSRRTFLQHYQSGLALKARQISESANHAEAVSFLTKALSSFGYLDEDYWSLLHFELGCYYLEMDKEDLARKHFRAAIEASPLSYPEIKDEFEETTKQKAKANLDQLESSAAFAGSWKILGALIGLGVLGFVGGLSTGDIGGAVLTSCFFLGLGFGYWKWKSR